jgi:hypothetical protein
MLPLLLALYFLGHPRAVREPCNPPPSSPSRYSRVAGLRPLLSFGLHSFASPALPITRRPPAAEAVPPLAARRPPAT